MPRQRSKAAAGRHMALLDPPLERLTDVLSPLVARDSSPSKVSWQTEKAATDRVMALLDLPPSENLRSGLSEGDASPNLRPNKRCRRTAEEAAGRGVTSLDLPPDFRSSIVSQGDLNPYQRSRKTGKEPADRRVTLLELPLEVLSDIFSRLSHGDLFRMTVFFDGHDIWGDFCQRWRRTTAIRLTNFKKWAAKVADSRALVRRVVCLDSMIELWRLWESENEGDDPDVEMPFDVAERLFHITMEHGNIAALTMLGVFYFNGDGVELSFKKAARLFTLGAYQGCARAMVNLGECYQYGWGVEMDEREAFDWFSRGGASGDWAAKFFRGRMLEEGELGEVDGKGALKFYMDGAECGDPSSQGRLGWAYCYGSGVARDFEHACSLFRAAIVSTRRGATKVQGIPHILDEVKEWALAKPLFGLGQCYEFGRGVEQNLLTAFSMYEAAAREGLAEARTKVGYFYLEGRGVRQDYAKAMHFLTIAAGEEDPVAYVHLGTMFRKGHGMSINLPQAFSYYEKARDLGSVDALGFLRIFYKHGLGVERNEEAAVDISERIEQARLEAQELLDEHDHGGLPHPRDEEDLPFPR
eukprot:TRINITY_DN689_c0_g1_i1.p1 TRINITY_DN689_c0_g1~~TRINITY_DN689_c0_g1_i1.p1  ORF type:complete len:583 (+),score=73.82 TRINITY_DN689_c0_g1_i1:825-2573(+)